MRHPDARMRDADCLREQQRCGNQPASQFTGAAGKEHGTILNQVEGRVDLGIDLRVALARVCSL